MTHRLMVLALAACNPVTGDVPVDAADEIDTPDAVDAAVGPCDLQKPFAALKPLPGVNSAADEDGVSLTADELTLFLSSNRTNGGTDFDLYVATRASIDDDFGAPLRLDQVSDGSDQRGLSISGDGLTLFYHSPINPSTSFDLYVSERGSTAVAFGPAVSVGSSINTTALELLPSTASAGSVLYFMRDDKIFRSTRGATGYGAGVELTGLVAPGRVAAEPTPSEDDQTLYFGSDRAGVAGIFDVFVAKRPSPSEPFGQPTRVEELIDSVGQTRMDWISRDGCRGYLWTDRAGGMGGFDIWQATRPR